MVELFLLPLSSQLLLILLLPLLKHPYMPRSFHRKLYTTGILQLLAWGIFHLLSPLVQQLPDFPQLSLLPLTFYLAHRIILLGQNYLSSFFPFSLTLHHRTHLLWQPFTMLPLVFIVAEYPHFWQQGIMLIAYQVLMSVLYIFLNEQMLSPFLPSKEASIYRLTLFGTLSLLLTWLTQLFTV